MAGCFGLLGSPGWWMPLLRLEGRCPCFEPLRFCPSLRGLANEPSDFMRYNNILAM